MNGSSLLVALGVPVTRHQDYLAIPSQWLPSHHHVPPTGENGIPHLAGVPGLWIPFQAAKELAKRCRMSEKSVLSNILRDDLFSLFATIANLNTTHSPSETFGLPVSLYPIVESGSKLTWQFVAGAALSSKNGGGGRPASASNNHANSSFAASSAANSRSTPNLSALGTSAPARSMTPAGLSMTAPGTPVTPVTAAANAGAAGAQNKGPLVRAAPAQPEGCPQPKRRRATIVGAAPVKPGLTPPVAPLTPTASAPAAAAPSVQNKPGSSPAAAQTGTTKATPIAPAPTKPRAQVQPAPGQGTDALVPATTMEAATPSATPTPAQTPRKTPPSTPATSAGPAASAQKTAAARRATRASVGGAETAKPKLVK